MYNIYLVARIPTTLHQAPLSSTLSRATPVSPSSTNKLSITTRLPVSSSPTRTTSQLTRSTKRDPGTLRTNHPKFVSSVKSSATKAATETPKESVDIIDQITDQSSPSDISGTTTNTVTESQKNNSSLIGKYNH